MYHWFTVFNDAIAFIKHTNNARLVAELPNKYGVFVPKELKKN